MAMEWMDFSSVCPNAGSTCYIRVKYYYGSPFLAIYSASLQGFTGIDSGVFIPAYAVARWSYYSEYSPYTNIGTTLAYRYAVRHCIPTDSSFFINELLPAFNDVFSQDYTDNLDTGYYYDTYKDSTDIDFVYVFKGYIRGTGAYTPVANQNPNSFRFLDHTNTYAVFNAISATDFRSSERLLFFFDKNRFASVASGLPLTYIEFSQNTALPVWKLPWFSDVFGYVNTFDKTFINTSTVLDCYYKSVSSYFYFVYVKGISVLYLNTFYTSTKFIYIVHDTDVESVVLPYALYASTSSTARNFSIYNSKLTTSQLDAIMAFLNVQITTAKATYGIKNNLVVNLSNNAGTLTGGTSNADYIALVALYSGTGYSVTITL